MAKKAYWNPNEWWWTWKRIVALACTASRKGGDCTTRGIMRIAGLSRRGVQKLMGLALKCEVVGTTHLADHSGNAWKLTEWGHVSMWEGLRHRMIFPQDRDYYFKFDAFAYVMRIWPHVEWIHTLDLTENQKFRCLRRMTPEKLAKVVEGARGTEKPGAYVLASARTQGEWNRAMWNREVEVNFREA
jgi:hypothetical protein